MNINDEALNAALALTKGQLAHFLEQMVKHHHYHYAYIELKDNFEAHFEELKRLANNHSETEFPQISMLINNFQLFHDQLSIYAQATDGIEKNDQLLKLCQIAADHFNITIPETYILDLKSELL